MTQPIINGSEVCPGCGKPLTHKLVPRYVDNYNIKWHSLCYSLREVNYKEMCDVDKETFTDDQWYLAIYEYLYSRICLPAPDWPKIGNQLKKYVEAGHSYKEIYYALVYAFMYKKNDIIKAQGGIGILNYMFDDSRKFWYDYISKSREQKNKIDSIIAHQTELLQQEKIKRIKKQEIKKDYKKELAKILDEEDY